MRAVAVLLVLFGAACGDDGPSEEERVRAVCDAWQAALDSSGQSQDAARAEMYEVAQLALKSESHMALLGMSLTESLDPFDEEAFRDAAAGFEEECG